MSGTRDNSDTPTLENPDSESVEECLDGKSDTRGDDSKSVEECLFDESVVIVARCWILFF